MHMRARTCVCVCVSLWLVAFAGMRNRMAVTLVAGGYDSYGIFEVSLLAAATRKWARHHSMHVDNTLFLVAPTLL